jgi:hypothetical protein
MSDPIHVPLPTVTLDMLNSQKGMLRELLGQCNVRTREQSTSTRLFGHRERFSSKTCEEHFTDLLNWLYLGVVSPIYRVLESVCDFLSLLSFIGSWAHCTHHGIHNGRLWWLTAGAFTGLPLHASSPKAGFIHSYTSTLGSLLEAYAKKGSPAKVGVVGVTHTSGHSNFLPAVKKEIQKISAIIKEPQVDCLEGEQATIDAVKFELQNCSWVHLACHGKQDLVEPNQSHLLLYDGILKLESILQMPLLNAEFVFLAACQTAMGDTKLVNESFHLGGGFIAAGFRGAIGTMWSIKDQDGPVVADIFYSYLFREGQQPQATDAAEALHFAVEELKAQKVPFERWIPFIHMGV